MEQYNQSVDDLIKGVSVNNDRVDSLLKKEGVKLDIDIAVSEDNAQPEDTVMVVDDDQSQLNSIQKILSNTYHLICCDRGKKAIETYKSEKDVIKSILLDIRLPDIEGFEVFKQIKDENNNIPIIFITGYQGTYGDGFEIYKEYRPHGYIVKNHENEMDMIRDTLANAVHTYKHIMENEKARTITVRNKMMAGLLHDLKNLFTPILMMPDIVANFISMGEKDRAMELMTTLKNSVEMFSANQQLLFNYAKGEHYRTHLTLYETGELMDNFLEMIRPQFEGQVDLQTDIQYTSTMITDKNILCCQVLLNMMKNAKEALLKHKEQNRIIRLEVYNFGQYLIKYHDNAVFSGKKPNDVVIVVSDNGPGIPKEIEADFFNPYVTHGKKEGTGLGSWMIKQGVEDYLKGQLKLINNVGLGVTYHIFLPQNVG